MGIKTKKQKRVWQWDWDEMGDWDDLLLLSVTLLAQAAEACVLDLKIFTWLDHVGIIMVPRDVFCLLFLKKVRNYIQRSPVNVLKL